jgi:hypothetical protein
MDITVILSNTVTKVSVISNWKSKACDVQTHKNTKTLCYSQIHLKINGFFPSKYMPEP